MSGVELFPPLSGFLEERISTSILGSNFAWFTKFRELTVALHFFAGL